MLLKPATPLTVFFFVAFVLLLLSTLSTPIIKSVPLASFQGYNFGVFGYCNANACTGATVGYGQTNLFPDGGFTLPSSTRHSLSSILVVHPIACFMTLICTCLALASHFHGPAHSPRYLLALLIFSFPTLLVTLLAFLVDILLFVPHMQWGGWIVLAATIIITACSVLTCAMRRTLVSRKARKKRIAENAEMNGQNYYAMQQDRYARAESPPTPNGVADKPAFTTYEFERGRPSADDRVPLTAKAPSVQTNSTPGTAMPRSEVPSEQGTPLLPGAGAGFAGREVLRDGQVSPIEREPFDNDRSDNRSRRDRDDYYSTAGGQRQYPRQGGQAPFPGRGRGGYPGPNGFPPRGNFQGQGGYPARGGYPSRGNQRGNYQGPRGPPPPGWQGYGRGRGAPGAMMGGMMPGRGGSGPPPNYQGQNRGAMVVEPYQQGSMYHMNPELGPGRSPSPELDGLRPPQSYSHGVSEMQSNSYPARVTQNAPIAPNEQLADARQAQTPGVYELNGTRSINTPQAFGSGEPVELAASPRSVNDLHFGTSNGREGPIELGQPSPRREPQDPLSNRNIAELPAHADGAAAMSPSQRLDTTMQNGNVVAATNLPSPDEYTGMPRRMGDSRANSRRTSNAASQRSHHSGSVHAADEVGSPMRRVRTSSNPFVRNNQAPGTPPVLRSGPNSRASSDVYVEDVDPRFAEETVPPVPATPPQFQQQQQQAAHMTPLPPLPSYALPNAMSQLHPMQRQQFGSAPRDPDAASSVYNGSDQGLSRTRSPAQSETSNFTSVSQRGINPAWRPQAPPSMPGSAYGGSQASKSGRWKAEDTILAANPDFALPGVGRGGFSARARGRGRANPIGPSMLGEGRYPTGDV